VVVDSVRIEHVAVIVVLPRNIGENQRTDEYGTLTVTVTSAPYVAPLGGSGLTVVVAPLMDAAERYVLTALVT